MVKIATRALKIGVQSPFGPILTVGARTFFPENFGLAYCTVGLAKIFEEKSAKPHGGNWVKTCMHTNFESSGSDFYHATRAPKVQMS